MPTRSHFLLFLNVTLCFLTAFAIKADEDRAVTVHVTNALPPNSQPIPLRCSSTDTPIITRELHVNEEYNWSVEPKLQYQCYTTWRERFFALWHAYEPQRDAKQSQVYWLVKEDGFYLSWDKTKWDRKYEWETG